MSHEDRIARLRKLTDLRTLYRDCIFEEEQKPYRFRVDMYNLKQDLYDLNDEAFRIETELRLGL